MPRVIHGFLVLCGLVLVGLRLYPSDDTGWISKLFMDDMIHARIEAVSIRAIQTVGVAADVSGSYAANFASLVHTFAILFQALTIALTFYLITRRI